jgi:hypothetical protein
LSSPPMTRLVLPFRLADAMADHSDWDVAHAYSAVRPCSATLWGQQPVEKERWFVTYCQSLKRDVVVAPELRPRKTSSRVGRSSLQI